MAIAARLARGLAGAAAEQGIVIGLSGALGAGKTTFVQGFVAALPHGGDQAVTSPTYAIAQQYGTEPPVRHLDLYRLSDMADLEAIGYRELYFPPGFALVEWIERVPEAIPDERVEIRLAVDPSDVREIEVRPHGARLAAAVAAIFP
jgi:tRNA threonylcarbamoyladenosine biosynthesis protein TsaE